MSATCADCGSPMVRRPAMFLCGPGMSGPVYGDPECSGEECRRRRLEEDRADQARRDEEAIARAVEAGVIDP